MTTTNELREAVARVIDPDAYTANNAWFILSAREQADRIIRLVVDACVAEVPGGNICDPQEIADRIRELAPKEPHD